MLQSYCNDQRNCKLVVFSNQHQTSFTDLLEPNYLYYCKKNNTGDLIRVDSSMYAALSYEKSSINKWPHRVGNKKRIHSTCSDFSLYEIFYHFCHFLTTAIQSLSPMSLFTV